MNHKINPLLEATIHSKDKWTNTDNCKNPFNENGTTAEFYYYSIIIKVTSIHSYY